MDYGEAPGKSFNAAGEERPLRKKKSSASLLRSSSRGEGGGGVSSGERRISLRDGMPIVADAKEPSSASSASSMRILTGADVPALSSPSTSSSTSSSASYSQRPLSARQSRPLSARRTIDLAPQRAIPPPSSSISPYEAPAAPKVINDNEKERRLAEKREKRRLLMEGEGLSTASSSSITMMTSNNTSSGSISKQQQQQQQQSILAMSPPTSISNTYTNTSALASTRPPPSQELVGGRGGTSSSSLSYASTSSAGLTPPLSSASSSTTKPKATAKQTASRHHQEEEGYDDDDFETYSGDEFEAEEEEKQTFAPSLSTRSAASSHISSSSLQKAEEKSNNNSNQRVLEEEGGEESGASKRSGGGSKTERSGSKGLPPSSSTSGSIKRGSFKVMWSSVSEEGEGTGTNTAAGGPRREPATLLKGLASLNPRAQRLKQIMTLMGGAENLEVEKFVAFDQQPIAKYDLYHRKLRGGGAAGATVNAAGSSGSNNSNWLFKQTACQTNEEDRSVETQTDDATLLDKSVQFYLVDDDTEFYDALEQAVHKVKNTSLSTSLAAASGSNTSPSRRFSNKELLSAADERRGGSGGEGEGGISRLLAFLQRAAPVCETLLEETIAQNKRRRRRRGREGEDLEEEEEEDDLQSTIAASSSTSIFAKRSEWIKVIAAGKPNRSTKGGTGEGGWPNLLAGRIIRDVIYNPHQSHLLLTVHGPSLHAGNASSRRKSDSSSSIGGGGGGGRMDATTGAGDFKALAVAHRDLVVIWDAALLMRGRGGSPSKILTSDGAITCVGFGPGLVTSIIMAGTENGAIHLWDLRESKETHMSDYCRRYGITMGLRPPTYSTLGSTTNPDNIMMTSSSFTLASASATSSCSYSFSSGHISPVAAITPIILSSTSAAAASSSSSASSTEASKKGSGGGGVASVIGGGQAGQQKSTAFQMASLDDRGTLTLWMVNEIGLGGIGAGRRREEAEMDLGLSPGGKVRLSRTRSLHLTEGWASPAGRAIGSKSGGKGGVGMRSSPFQQQGGERGVLQEVNWDLNISEQECLAPGPIASCLAFFPLDPSRFIAGLHYGVILHRSRFGHCKAPLVFTRGSLLACFPAVVTTLQFCPSSPQHFLAGYSDGLVALFHESDPEPRMTWDTSTLPSSSSSCCGVTDLCWSPHRPSVFYVTLGGKEVVLVYDVLLNDKEPLFIESLLLSKKEGGKGEGKVTEEEDQEEGGGNGGEVYSHISLSGEKATQITSGQRPCLALVAPLQGLACLRLLRTGLYHPSQEGGGR